MSNKLKQKNKHQETLEAVEKQMQQQENLLHDLMTKIMEHLSQCPDQDFKLTSVKIIIETAALQGADSEYEAIGLIEAAKFDIQHHQTVWDEGGDDFDDEEVNLDAVGIFRDNLPDKHTVN